MRNFQLPDEASVDAALRSDRFLFFKHSHRCSISHLAFGEYEAFAADHSEVPHGWVDVVGQRALSNRIAEVTGVTHGSPQAIWIVAGRAVWSASHFDITERALAEAVASGAVRGLPA